MKIESENLARWLNLTEQQNHILQAVYKLESAGAETTPKNILQEYSKVHGKRMQSNNLFTIIKILADYRLILKKEKARYGVNIEGIRDRLMEKSQEQKKELENVDELIKNLHEYYKSLAIDTRPQMVFYNSRELFTKVAETLKNASTYYITSRMPNIAFSRPLANKLWIDRYVDMLQDRCFIKKDLKVTYITQLMTEHLYKHALEIYGKPELAVREVEMILDHLWDNIESNENLKVYYLPNPTGVYLGVTEKQGEPTEVILFLQSEENVNGIYLKSHEIAYHARESFLRGLESATPLEGARGRRLINQARQELRSMARSSTSR